MSRIAYAEPLKMQTSFSEGTDKSTYRRSHRSNGVTTNFRGREEMIKKDGGEKEEAKKEARKDGKGGMIGGE